MNQKAANDPASGNELRQWARVVRTRVARPLMGLALIALFVAFGAYFVGMFAAGEMVRSEINQARAKSNLYNAHSLPGWVFTSSEKSKKKILFGGLLSGGLTFAAGLYLIRFSSASKKRRACTDFLSNRLSPRDFRDRMDALKEPPP